VADVNAPRALKREKFESVFPPIIPPNSDVLPVCKMVPFLET